MNELRNDDNQLPISNYQAVLKAILSQLSSYNPFHFSPETSNRRLRINAHKIAQAIAQQSLSSPLTTARGVAAASQHLSQGDQAAFSRSVQEIRDRLREHFHQAANQQNLSPQDIIPQLFTPLQNFTQTSAKSPFTYDFKSHPNLKKSRLQIDSESPGSHSVLKFHKLTIVVQNLAQFEGKFRQSLTQEIQNSFPEDEQETLMECLEEFMTKPHSELQKLKKFVSTESLGKIKREAKIHYLEYLYEQLDPASDIFFYMQDLCRRLKWIENYIYNPDRADEELQISYQGTSLNLRDSMATAHAFDSLPIIPIIAGYLGENKNEQEGTKTFIFGMKLKFGGLVNAQGETPQTTLNYYLNLVNPDSKEHQESLKKTGESERFKRKVLNLTFLYYFMFFKSQLSDLKKPNNDQEILQGLNHFFQTQFFPIFQGNNEEKKTQFLRKIYQRIKTVNLEARIQQQGKDLKKLLKQQAKIDSKVYISNLLVKKGILIRDIDEIIAQESFFKPVFRERVRDALRYISMETTEVSPTSITHFPVSFTFEDIHYFPASDTQSFSMEYQSTELQCLPILFFSITDKESPTQKYFEKYLKGHSSILINYNPDLLNKPNQQTDILFYYRLVFSLLSYLCLFVILEKNSDAKRVFIPFLRLHLSNIENSTPDESFIASFSNTISHLLGNEYLTNCQGLNIKELDTLQYRLNNARSSLYSVLPKIFYFSDPQHIPQLEKLAILIVSSRVCDRNYSSQAKISNLIGEIIGIEKTADQKIVLQRIKTLSANYSYTQIYRDPLILQEAVHELYQEGYRHILYIAKSPYSSTLNLTEETEEEGLFFMSRSVIESLKGNHQDLRIYPIFFDKYYGVSSGISSESLYIQDTSQLSKIVPASLQSVVFFNLFNGKKVGKGDEKFYNGVISYATLLNIYSGILDDEDIRKALIYDQQENTLKTDILQYLTLFHFSRYEAVQGISLKLDPYEGMIGDNGVGALSIFNHIQEKVQFNLLAFLTKVKNAARV